jgi:hypothetical protein
VKRRSVLAVVAGLGLSGALGWRFFGGSEEDGVAVIVHKRLDYLKLDPAGVRQFSRDYAERRLISGAKLRAIAGAAAAYQRLDFLAGIVRHGEDRIVTKYLLSSDFFRSGADESRTVHYLGFFDPLRSCGNPWARAVDTGGSDGHGLLARVERRSKSV